jgi:hypothetical protein
MAGYLGQYKAIEKLKEAVIWHGRPKTAYYMLSHVLPATRTKKNKQKSQSETGTLSFCISYGKSPYGHSQTFSDHQKRKQITVNDNRQSLQNG